MRALTKSLLCTLTVVLTFSGGNAIAQDDRDERGEDSPSTNQETKQTPQSQLAKSTSTSNRPKEVRRDPIYNHGPGPNSIVAYRVIYADGSSKIVPTGAGTNSSSTSGRSPSGNRFDGAERTSGKSRPVDYAYVENVRKQGEILSQGEKDIRSGLREFNQNLENNRDGYYDMQEKERRLKSDLQRLETEKGISERRWALTNYSYCPNGASARKCTHPREIEKWLQDRQSEMQMINQQIAQTKAQLDRVQKEKEEFRQRILDSKRVRVRLEEAAAEFRRKVRRQNAGEIWLSPNGKPPVFYPRSSRTTQPPTMRGRRSP